MVEAQNKLSTGRTRINVVRVFIVLLILGLVAVPATSGLKGCGGASNANMQYLKIGDKAFFLEVAADEPTRMKGLGQRDHIEANGGMLFVFANPVDTAFVMRDCPIDIDIIFVDPTGRITAMHQMKAEAPRGEGEGKSGDFSNQTYENRLKKYPSRYPAQFVVELKGGTIPSLTVKEGDKLDLPLAALKSRAK